MMKSHYALCAELFGAVLRREEYKPISCEPNKHGIICICHCHTAEEKRELLQSYDTIVAVTSDPEELDKFMEHCDREGEMTHHKRKGLQLYRDSCGFFLQDFLLYHHQLQKVLARLPPPPSIDTATEDKPMNERVQTFDYIKRGWFLDGFLEKHYDLQHMPPLIPADTPPRPVLNKTTTCVVELPFPSSGIEQAEGKIVRLAVPKFTVDRPVSTAEITATYQHALAMCETAVPADQAKSTRWHIPHLMYVSGPDGEPLYGPDGELVTISARVMLVEGEEEKNDHASANTLRVTAAYWEAYKAHEAHFMPPPTENKDLKMEEVD